MSTMVIRLNDTATVVVSSQAEKETAIKQAKWEGFYWCSSSKIPDPTNPKLFLKHQYRLHFRRKTR